jgi:sugar lactone lactonase YvrE
VHLLKGKKANRRKISSFVVPSDIVYKDIALDSSGCVYVLGGHFSENRGRDVYVLGPDGKHMARFALPDTSHCIHIDDQDYLYVRANDGVTLKKYRMHFAYEE